MRHAAPLILAAALVGCGSSETKDDPKTPVVSVRPEDSPAPMGDADAPDFGEPKPPIAASSKLQKDVESTRDALLHDDRK
jgi:hypothetical protein